MVRVLLASQNSIKLEEVRAIFPDTEVLDIDLHEVQATDVSVVVRHKLEQVAALGLPHPVVVEDTGLALEAWDGLPGALIKWFVGHLGAQRLKEVALGAGGPARATAVSAVGVVHGGECRVWEGRLDGRIVDARGELGGWTPVFEVADTGQTLAEMSFEDRLRYTMRREPLEHAREWLTRRQAAVA
ncbi:non-canonical purine NTP pyrophosphatase [Streptomyces caelestis]|uniref:Non-canonical purine NTP pyrophosphatase (RdgB/HAM1 family) n=1 Tax=Streptomyces caelestis TaxID=36816 RepID=A0A7W9H062_9ACTN|nr:non-canonical purine NTP pyrophosphatase [Streptomyces caelestis]MBB5792891.1 non-canonical purine NTP pyrophosphatase (RdgB/HAM1 family) [Streptomyces caelestis]GGW75788.1 hypothetical protein GCM10010320_67170 [Streptomyces caelestis]